MLGRLYGESLALLTDLYQLTMAYAYWKSGYREAEGVFHLTFRKNPFDGGFAIACGLENVLDWATAFRFAKDDLDYLASLQGNDGKALFDGGFLEYLAQVRPQCDVHAVPEGTVVFPHEPLVRVQGPLIQCQLFETALLTLINFSTLIATKAARINEATRGEPVLEFGLRRAQGIDGGVSASRAAYIGGCAATSNVLAGKLYGIPVRGTHAHSWVMAFPDELEAFQAYAEAMPNNCILLVDTYDTEQGVRNAVKIGGWLREQGKKLIGVRLDSGDLAYLSKRARVLLDEAGFHDAAIVASNDLDEHVISSLKQQDATIGVWGVGTRLATAYDQPALGGVYKLAALRHAGRTWEHKIKLSEQAIKISTPGILQVRRFRNGAELAADMVYDELTPLDSRPRLVDPLDSTRQRRMAETDFEDLLIPVIRQGKTVYSPPSLDVIRSRVREQLAGCHEGIKRFVNPHQYPVGLEKRLHDKKTQLVLAAREALDDE